jgi:phenylalanyl-tRNA synthetase beta chain
MNAEEIINNHKKGQQYGYLINRHDRYPVFVDGTGKIMCLIPIVNSAESGKVDVDTEDIFIEVTGMEMHTCKAALNILVCTFADMGGDIYDVEMVYGKERFRTPELAPKIMKLDLKDISRILGVVLKEKEVVGLLRKMGYGYKAGRVSIPPYRADIMGIIDIIEDIAIAYGYNNFKPTTANFFSAGNMIKKYDNIDRIFCGMGFFEAKTFILTNKNKLDIVGSVDEVVEISNPGTVDYTVVRPHLLVDILGIFEINKMKALPQKFYEVGVVYGDEGYNKRLVFGVMDKKIEFSEVRGYLQTFGFESGFDFHLVKKKMPIFEDEFSCVIMLKEREVGVFGKVNRKILERLGLGFEVYICEIKI